MWRARFGRGFGPEVRQTTKLMINMSTNEPAMFVPLSTNTAVIIFGMFDNKSVKNAAKLL
jgi:hypothetical protein